MNESGSAARIREAKTAGALAPVEDYLAELHARIAKVSGGKPADYIPELGKADPVFSA